METSKNLGRQLTLEDLISSQEDSHANHTASQDSERVKTMNATCGQRCCALFENAPRATSWAKMFAALLVGMEGWSSKRCVLTWKLKGTPFNRSYFQLAASTHPTEDTEYGLLPTITTETGRKSDFKQGGKSMFTALNEKGMLPTPNAFDWNTPRSEEAWEKSKDKWGDSLHTPLKQLASQGLLPTPATRDYKGANSMDHLTRDSNNRNHHDQLPNGVKLATGKTFQLSPLFVEEMMGFPSNWTALPFLSGDEKA